MYKRQVLKALEKMAELNYIITNLRTAAVYTDSRVTLDSLRSSRNHSYLIEEIRNKLRSLKAVNWSIDFGWVKAHVGIYGNELADNLASSSMVCYEPVSYTHLDVYKRQK